MKHLFTIIIVGLLFGSCVQSEKTYLIQGVIADSIYNNRRVYMFDYDADKKIDSALIANGRFSFSGQPDTLTYVRLELDRKYANVIREAGIIKVDLSDPLSVTGTVLNEKFINYNKELHKVIAAKSGYEAFVNYRNKLFDANSKNAVGIHLFNDMYYGLPAEKVDSLYNKLNDSVKNHASIQKIMKNNEKKKLTSAGKMFSDFTVKDGNIDGSSVSFSDYIGKGKYVLVDFWASWCGPCVAEMPVVAEIYKKYKSDKFEVLGLAVFDSREKLLEAMKTHNITWPQIIDTEDISRKLYEIEGVPQMILFAPDGTILDRDALLRGDKLKAKIAEILEVK